MGGGKQKSIERAPCAKPPFTVSDIKKAIPPHCFQPTVLRSLSYVILDLSLLSIFYFFASNYFPLLPSTYCYFAWPAYWAIQGCVCFGCWVIGHECGHHAFSDYQWLDDTVGFFIHTSLMIPYFSLKFSHRRHHSYSGCLDQDDVFAPMCKSQLPWYSKYLNNPPGRVANLVFTITLGWPLYLAINIRGTYDRFASHYDPYGPIFKERERFYIFISDAGLVAFIYLLYRVALAKGLAWVICLYGVPVSVMNGLVVLVTLLQHTHPALPRYDLTEWDWLRGALVTADRDYGLLNNVFHHIGDTHVLHHIFTRVPHYHAIEATKSMKPLLGDYYKFDDTPIYSALWREAKDCLYVEQDEGSPKKGVYWYKNKY